MSNKRNSENQFTNNKDNNGFLSERKSQQQQMSTQAIEKELYLPDINDVNAGMQNNNMVIMGDN